MNSAHELEVTVVKRKSINGQSIVETAITLPLVLLLIMGIIDFGLLFNNFIIVSNAAREGARAASVGGTDASIQEKIAAMTVTFDPARLTVTITPGESTRVHGGDVEVDVVYRSLMITPLIESFFEGGVPLEASTVMRVE